MFEIPAGLLSWFYRLTNNYALAIALIAVVLMAVITPLTLKSTKGMLEMQRLAPELRKLQQQYRNDSIYLEPPVAERENRFLSLAWDQELNAAHRLRLVAAHSRFAREEPWFVNLPPIVFRQELGQLYNQNRRCANSVVAGVTTGCTPADMPLVVAVATAAAQPGMTTFTGFVADNEVHERRDEIELQHTWVLNPSFRKKRSKPE